MLFESLFDPEERVKTGTGNFSNFCSLKIGNKNSINKTGEKTDYEYIKKYVEMLPKII